MDRMTIGLKATLVGCCILLVALPGLLCNAETSPTVTITEGSLSLSVIEVEGGIMIENLSDADCIVYVRSPEGEQAFKLAVGEAITVIDVSKPIEVAAFGA